MTTGGGEVGATMDEQRLVKISKYLSKHLRHRPDRLGITLAPGGWVGIDELLTACRLTGFALTRGELAEVVERNDKRRFGLDPSGTRIRANQGHSVEVDLQLVPSAPPEVLYHGTASTTVTTILEHGLRPMGRHHVHLSADIVTAANVGARHGSPVVLQVAAGRMHAAGTVFVRSANGVWLVDHVPARDLEVMV